MIPHRPSRLALAIAWTLTGCATAWSSGGDGDPLRDGLEVRLTESTYLVEGMVMGEAMEEMQWKGPVVDGRRVPASTEWHLGWTFKVAPADPGCRLTDVVVTLDMTVTLPRWLDRDRTPSRDGAIQWDRMLRELRSHEGHHQQIAREEAGLLLTALRGLSDADCGALGRAAVAQARSHQARLEVRQRTLDGWSGGGREDLSPT